MYGIVNKAIEEMVSERFGEETWRRICLRAGAGEDGFLSHFPYPDDITYALVGAVCEETGLDSSKVLEAFGRYWVLETGRKHYGGLLEAGGHSLTDFLLNLPNFHVRICLIYPELQPPEFLVEALGPTKIHLKYFSQRPGLTHFVVGLLYGIAELFNTQATVECLRLKENPDDCDEFLICW